MIAYVVPDGYTVGNTDEINNAYVLKLTKEVTKLFGGSRIVTVYEQETGITYILPDSVRDLFADQPKNSCPANGSCASASDDNDCSCGRTYEFSTLRLEFGENAMYRAFYDKELLLKRYVLGLDKKNEDGTLVHFLDYDIENAGGFDKNGKKVDTTASRYTSGYFATLYLCELSAKSHPQIGTSIKETEGGLKTFDNTCLKNGLDNILARMHGGESLDSVIKDISNGRFKNTADFEARFIKGTLKDGEYTGDDESLQFAVDFMDYMQRISIADGRQNIANGSILFDFEQDFAIPLDPNKDADTSVFKIYPSKDYVYSTVNPNYAHTSGGKSVDGTPMKSNTQSFTGSAATDASTGDGGASSAAKESTSEVDSAADGSSGDLTSEVDSAAAGSTGDSTSEVD